MVTCTKPPHCCNEDFVTAFETEEGPRVLSWSRGRQRGGQPQRVDVSPTLAVPRRGGGAELQGGFRRDPPPTRLRGGATPRCFAHEILKAF